MVGRLRQLFLISLAQEPIAPCSNRGYALFFPNPRGSFGQGEAFTQANVRDFGYGDLRDILAGIDAVKKEAPIDDARLGITGGSYGGFMTMWTVTQSNRFKAGVAGAGIANWLSYYGENGIDEWMLPYFGASVYDDPHVYAIVAHHLHPECEDAGLRLCRREGHRMPRAANGRVLACAP